MSRRPPEFGAWRLADYAAWYAADRRRRRIRRILNIVLWTSPAVFLAVAVLVWEGVCP